jgi:hypothetical protein
MVPNETPPPSGNPAGNETPPPSGNPTPNATPPPSAKPVLKTAPMDSRLAAVLMVLFAGLMVPAAWFFPPGWSYVTLMGLMIAFMIVLGLKICGRFAGILINDRNLMSLSRFQMILWTVLILSAFLTAAIERIHFGGTADALAIALDEKLWMLLGISTASLVGMPMVQSTKKVQQPHPEAVEKAAKALDENETEIAANSQGVLYANPDAKDAAFTDMFEGDEVGNTAYIDVSKVQMFFFTLVAVLSYGTVLFNWLSEWQSLLNPAAFPELNAGLIAILGISHAGFLGSQSTTKTPTT